MTPVNRTELEEALDGRRLWIMEEWTNGPRWYLVRRNGRTKLWTKDKARWEIPIKWKLKETFRIGDKNFEVIAPRLKAYPGPGNS